MPTAGRCLVIRWGAHGDLLFALPLLEHLKKKYGYLHLESSPQGNELFRSHPAFDKITTFDIWQYPVNERNEVAKIRWEALESAGWDRVINLWQTLEIACLSEQGQPEHAWPRERRRAYYGDKLFHEMCWKKAGEPIPDPFDCGTFFFDEDVAWWMKSFRERHADEFIISIPVRGHVLAPQKRPQGIKELARRILDEYPDARLFLLGDKAGVDHQFTFGDKRVAQMAGLTNFQQALAYIKLSDFAFGVESSLLVGAGLFGVPKSAICTASGLDQVVRHHKNDFSVQSHAPCSPCHRAIYNADLCLTIDKIPACNYEWDTERVMEGVALAHKMRFLRRRVDRIEGRRFGSLPDLQSLHDHETDSGDEVRPQVPTGI